MKTSLLSLKDASFSYEASRAPALYVDSLDIREGDSLALVGRNGSGKSTLLLLLAGLLKPQKGERLSQVSLSKIALAFQTPCLDKKLTVAENLRLFGKIWGMKRSQIDSVLASLAPALGLNELLERRVQALSGGQQRRADLARALLVEPSILFLDEPTVGLDVIAQREFWGVLAEAKKIQPGLTLICASHHAAELRLFARIVFLHAGKIAFDVAQSALLNDLPDETIELNTQNSAQFFQESLVSELQLKASIVAHDKLLIHTQDASETLEKLKVRQSLQSKIDSVLIRKTQMSDAVWHRLLQISESQGQAMGSGLTP